MDIQQFMTLLAGLTVISGIITQTWKRALEKTPSNLIALASSLVTGFFGTMIYAFAAELPITGRTIVTALIMGAAVWISSMCGYDKIKQLIEQIGGAK